MARQVVSHRLDSELLQRATAYAEARGTTRSVLIEAGLRSLLDGAETGVPDLPVADSPGVRRQRVQSSVAVRPARELVRDPDAMSRQARLNAAALRRRQG